MTSLEIAELTGKQHKDVMKAIRNMEPAWVKVNGRKFALVEYKDAKGEFRGCILR
jgi:phage regulator Rha-like protein